MQMAVRVCWGSARRGAVNGSRDEMPGAQQRGQMGRGNAEVFCWGEVIVNGGGGGGGGGGCLFISHLGYRKVPCSRRAAGE